MHLLFLLSICLAFVAVRTVLTIFQLITSPLRNIPGPEITRYTNLWYFYRVWRGNAHHDNIALHRKYAPANKHYADVVRLGPKMYSIAHVDKAVYDVKSRMPKSDWYQGWKHPSPDRWTLFTDPDMTRHRATRSKFQAMYSLSSLVSYEQYVDNCTQILQQRLTEIATAETPINMTHWLQCYAFDVIGDITYSKRFGFLDRGEDVAGAMAALDKAMVYGTLVGIYSWAHPALYALMEKIPGTGAAGRNYIMRFVRERISERERQRQTDVEKSQDEAEEDEDTPRDFLDKIMTMQKQEGKHVTDYHVFMLGMSNIVAGSDTTAVSLSSILYHLVKNPKVMQKLREEGERCEEEGQCTPDRVAFKNSQNMKYLQACIKEGLRMHPATGLPLWRVVPPGGAEICGRFFPGGSVVGINTWVAHYNEDIWGKDATEFRPERWTEAEAEGGDRLKTMEHNWMPFGLGSRTCIGRHISQLEMSKLIPVLVRCFDFELETPDRDWQTLNYWFVKPANFKLKVKIRQS